MMFFFRFLVVREFSECYSRFYELSCFGSDTITKGLKSCSSQGYSCIFNRDGICLFVGIELFI